MKEKKTIYFESHFSFYLFAIFKYNVLRGSQQGQGHCTASATCNHVTDHCDWGCANGWTRCMCEKGIHGDWYF